jgi:tRNA dimethylallyltransferase
MLDAGLLEEVRTLHGRGDLHPNLPSMRSVGYRQAWRFVEGQCTFNAFRADGITATRQLAKRQMTWLRSMANVTVIEPTSKAALSVVGLLL